MSTLVVVQARTGSTRLPGKVLVDLGGRPLLTLLLQRVLRLDGVDVVVATSDLDQDDAVASLAAAQGVDVVRGPEADVLARFALALEAHPADEVVRITADCPLTDPGLIRAVLALRAATEADYAGNTPIRTFPDGLDVEAFSADVLRRADAEASDPEDREHVTRFVLGHPDRFRLANLRTTPPMAAERWTVDTFEDLKRVRSIVIGLHDPVTASWTDVLEVAGRTVPDAELALQPHVVADVLLTDLEAP